MLWRLLPGIVCIDVSFHIRGGLWMNRKAMSIWLSGLLIGTLFTVIFAGSVSAMNDEQNLSGYVWQADGSPLPPGQHDFCIWVNHSGVWYRFPDTGWAL